MQRRQLCGSFNERIAADFKMSIIIEKPYLFLSTTTFTANAFWDEAESSIVFLVFSAVFKPQNLVIIELVQFVRLLI